MPKHTLASGLIQYLHMAGRIISALSFLRSTGLRLYTATGGPPPSPRDPEGTL